MKKALFIGLSVLLAVSCTKEADQAAPGAVAKNSVTIDGVAIDKTAEVYVLTSPITVNSEAYPAFLPSYVDDTFKGSFCSGSSVTINPFIMGKYEVTQELYEKVMTGQSINGSGLNATPSYCQESTLASGENQLQRPVERISWYDAVYFCNILSEISGYKKAYTITDIEVATDSVLPGTHITSATVTVNSNADGYRLPTGEEWEFAARGGDPSKADWNYMFSGAQGEENVAYDAAVNSGINSVGWYDANIGENIESHQVGKKNPNRLGLFDMTGNVCEWCFDEESSGDGGRLERGGGWQLDAFIQIVTKKFGVPPAGKDEYWDLGFRIVRSVK